MYSTRIARSDPTAVNVTVTATVSCKTFSNLTNVQANIHERTRTICLHLRQGSIGLDIYLSDIITTIKEADSNVEFVQLTSPTLDMASLHSGRWELLSLIRAPRRWHTPCRDVRLFAVNVTSSFGGSSAPAKWASITTTAPNSASD
jgi:hypothetical protein